MKQLFIGLLTVLAGVAVAYYLNLKSPDLRYQISRPIPTETDATGPAKLVQQIEIANVGKAVAQKVQVRIRKAVGKLAVIKDSQSDSYLTFNDAGSTELIYNSLQPAGRIQVVLSGGVPLAEQDVEIRHLEGRASLALTSESSLWSRLASYLSLTIIVLYWWLSAWALTKDHFTSKSRWEPAAILKRRKPLLVFAGEWTSILEEAASHAADRKYGETGDVASWQVYKLLNSGKPEQMSDEMWDRVVSRLQDGFMSRIEVAASEAHVFRSTAKLGKMLMASKPSAVFDEPWVRLMKSLSATYVAALRAEDIEVLDLPSHLVKRFAEAKPDGVVESDWKSRANWLQSLYCASLFEELHRSAKPMEYLNSADLTPLSRSKAETLKTYAYYREMKRVPDMSAAAGADQFLSAGKPAFMSDEDYERLTKTAQTIMRVAEDERKHSSLLHQMNNLLTGSPLSTDRPSAVSQDEWSNLKRIEQEIVTVREENQRRGVELTRQEDETSTLMKKVLRQLDVINTFMSDPDVLNRIEDYEGVFAPGNLANLRSLAVLRQSTSAP